MHTRLIVMKFVGAAIVAGALIGTAQSAGGPRPKPLKPIKPQATVATATAPGSIVSTSGAIWIGTVKGVQRIDPKTNAVVATIPTPPNPSLAAGGGAVWAADFDNSVVRKIDPATYGVVATIKVGANPQGTTFTNGALWVANKRGGSVSRVDPATNTVVATVKAGLEGPSGPQEIAAGFGDVWVAVSNINSVVRIDTATNRSKAQVQLPAAALACGAIVAVKSALWVSSCAERPIVTQVDQVKNKAVGTVIVGGWANGVVVVGGKAWYAVSRLDFGKTSRLVRVEPGKKLPTAVRELDRSVKDPSGMLLAFGSLWLTDARSGKVLRFAASVLN